MNLVLLSIILMIGYVVPTKQRGCVFIDYIQPPPPPPPGTTQETNGSLPEENDANADDGERSCSDEPICRKTFNISFIKQDPYYSNSPVLRFIRRCCGDCVNFTIINTFADISKVNMDQLGTSHFVYPFLRSHSTAKRLYGHYFIPTIEAPTTFYFTLKDEHAMVKLFNACLEMYPLIVICLLMAVLSGFVAWFMETWSNKDEFPREFLLGWFEGFWWSFVSMTTVGYGDKTPRTFVARIFSVIWILIGIITFDILTATLTAQVTSVTSLTDPKMEGKYVGALKYRTHEAHIIAKFGGKYKPTDGDTFLGSMMELIDMLNKTKEISGFLLDMYSVWNANIEFNKAGNDSTVRAYHHFFQNKLRSSEKVITGEKLSYGMLVRDFEDYEYFNDVFVDNALVMETSLALEWNYEKNGMMKKPAVFLTSDEGPYFKQTIQVVAAFIGAITTFGVLYELYRRKTTIKKFRFKEIVKVSIENYGIEMKRKDAIIKS